jgi:alanine racemase
VPPAVGNASETELFAAVIHAATPIYSAALDQPPPHAWLEINLQQFRRNWQAINAYKPEGVRVGFVVKDDAYGHGVARLAPVAAEFGVEMFAVASLREALELRSLLDQPILLLGERIPQEYETCLACGVVPCVSSYTGLAELQRIVRKLDCPFPLHLKIDTGMSRYGFRWSELDHIFAKLRETPTLVVDGMMSHFAMSDELDKTFARLQLSRFNEAVTKAKNAGLRPRYLHTCNSGGFLDLPEAHFNLVRIGILPLGVFPSKVCRRLDGIAPIMSVKARIAAVKNLQAGDHVGYGMRFTAKEPMRIGVIPIGYGHGFPRVRNQGFALVHGKRAPIIGGVSMDAITVDLTPVIEAQQWDEVTLLGPNGEDEITIHDIAALRNTVSYDAMVSWSTRLPRVYVE